MLYFCFPRPPEQCFVSILRDIISSTNMLLHWSQNQRRSQTKTPTTVFASDFLGRSRELTIVVPLFLKYHFKSL